MEVNKYEAVNFTFSFGEISVNVNRINQTDKTILVRKELPHTIGRASTIVLNSPQCVEEAKKLVECLNAAINEIEGYDQ